MGGRHSGDKGPPEGEVRVDEEETPLPGTAAMAQGQPAAGVEPGGEDGVPAQDDHPEQAGGPVTGAEMLVVQQQDPELKDNTGGHP